MSRKISELEVTRWISQCLTEKYGVPLRLVDLDGELVRDMRLDDDDISEFLLDIQAHFGVSLVAAFNARLWPNGQSRPGKAATFSDVVAIVQASFE